VRARFIPSETTTNRTYESRMFSVVWCTGGTTSPSSPPFPLAGRGRAKRRKDAGYCHLCHCHCHCQTLNAVAVQKTGAYAGITWQTSSAQAILFMRPEYGPSTGRTAAFCTQAGKVDTVARLQCIMGAFGSTVQQARSCPASMLAALLFPSGVVGSWASGTIQLWVLRYYMA
jgi:hypothetical protein